MNIYVAIVLAVPVTAWAVVAWDIGRKWIAERSAAALHLRQQQHEEAVARDFKDIRDANRVTKLAIENLAKEVDENIATLRAQQVGLLSGMQQRQRMFK